MFLIAPHRKPVSQESKARVSLRQSDNDPRKHYRGATSDNEDKRLINKIQNDNKHRCEPSPLGWTAAGSPQGGWVGTKIVK